jgi:hypothetical protein
MNARRCTVGELVDLANSLPRDWVRELAQTLTDSISGEGRPSPAYRRKLVLLGALLNRIIFEIEDIAKSRSTRL